MAGAPPFGLLRGEGWAHLAAEQAGIPGMALLFLLGGALTAAVVFRVGMHTFLGWGTMPLTDSAAKIDEKPETKEENRRVFAFHFGPAAVCLVLAAAVAFAPHLSEWIGAAAARMESQPGYQHVVYTGASVQPALPAAPNGRALLEAGLRGLLAVVLALGLAASSVFRARLPRWAPLGALMEGPMKPWRVLQSGHPGTTWCGSRWSGRLRHRGDVPLAALEARLLRTYTLVPASSRMPQAAFVAECTHAHASRVGGAIGDLGNCRYQNRVPRLRCPARRRGVCRHQGVCCEQPHRWRWHLRAG